MTDTHTTAHIPDEVVDAAFEAMNPMKSPSECCLYDVRKGLAAALPHLSAPCAVDVRELGWKEVFLFDGRKQWQSDDIESIAETHPLWSVQGFRLFRAGTTYSTLEEAKAAAQADFERRILSCVVTKPVDVAAVRNQAFDALKKAEQFIENGVEFGFIKLPDSNDPALETLPKIKGAIRALSAEPAQGEQWKPIETAPKDGTQIIVPIGNGLYDIVSWYCDGWREGANGLRLRNDPTRWAPIPAAPTPEASK